MKIRYSLGKSPFGVCGVATSERGVCFLAFGNSSMSAATLLGRLHLEFPAAEIKLAAGKERAELQRILKTLGTDSGLKRVKLDIQGTDFQKRVWGELRRIPHGATRSYSDVAQAIGAPSAVRAVAKACASNKIGVLIPCHRVVSKSGSLAGYRWGVERKQKLLAGERARR